MDELNQPPVAPLPTGDLAGGPGATTDALREVLRRHRRRQSAAIAVGLAVVLVAGGIGGWAVGQNGRSPGGTQVAAGTPTSTSTGTGSSAGPAVVVGGAVPVPGVQVSIGPDGGGPSTQVLVRDATDGTRVRLYQGSLPVPTVTCPPGASCPTPVAACAPTASVEAEVSDDQVAGSAIRILWGATANVPVELDLVGVVGANQPQPILVVVGRTSATTAKVTLTTSGGTDSAAPVGGYVALAVRLPSGFSTDSSTGLPTGTVAASDAGGTTLASLPLAPATEGAPGCAIGCQVTSTPASPPSGAVNGATAAPPAPTPTAGGCPPCGPVPAGAAGVVSGGSGSAAGSSGSNGAGVVTSSGSATVGGATVHTTVRCVVAQGGQSGSGFSKVGVAPPASTTTAAP